MNSPPISPLTRISFNRFFFFFSLICNIEWIFGFWVLCYVWFLWKLWWKLETAEKRNKKQTWKSPIGGFWVLPFLFFSCCFSATKRDGGSVFFWYCFNSGFFFVFGLGLIWVCFVGIYWIRVYLNTCLLKFCLVPVKRGETNIKKVFFFRLGGGEGSFDGGRKGKRGSFLTFFLSLKLVCVKKFIWF